MSNLKKISSEVLTKIPVKVSIRLKLFIVVGGIVAFFVLLSWILNNFLLERYYFYSKKNTLMECYRLIDGIYKGEPGDIAIELEKLESTKNVNIIIFNSKFMTKYILKQRIREPIQPKGGINSPNNSGRTELSDLIGIYELLLKSKAEQILVNRTIIDTGKDNRLNTNFIRLFSLLNNGDYLSVSASISAIQDSADIANKFSILTGILTIILGSIFIFFFTGRLTKPILELNNITKKMAKLDFSKRYSVKNNDEIGQLGSSINSLSEQLEKSISELQAVNQKLKEDIEKERKIDEMRKELISNVSHELKTPIALIQGYAEGLLLNIANNEEDKNYYCSTIIDEANSMNKLVKQLLELSKLESGVIELEKTDFNVTELIEHVLRKLFIKLKGKNIKVISNLNDDIIVNADFDRMEQVLTNYLDNAINHVNEQKIINIKIYKKGEKCRIIVYNSGDHIQDNNLDKLWTSFYKVDKARTRSYGGTGLGLSIVKAIQEAHQNKYGVYNVEDGIEFWFEIDCSYKKPI